MDEVSTIRTLPPSEGSPQPSSKNSLILAGLSVVLFISASLGLWQLIANHARIAQSPSVEFYVSLVVTVGSLLALTFVLMRESKLSVQKVLGDDYQIRLGKMQDRLNYREDMLRLISNHQTTAVAIFDRHNRFFFVNDVMAEQIKKPVMEIIGQPPIKVLANDLAMKLELRLAEVRTAEAPIEATERVVDDKGVTRFFKRHFAMVKDIPDLSGCVILREEDYTDLIVEKERREQMLKQVIDTLVAVVDRRDPYATGHSARVGQLAKAIAVEMGLDKMQVEAAEIAGSLMNFGKVLVSRKILTKTSALTTEELQRVRDSILISSDILAIIGFAGPVVPTLRQVLERFDGTGTPGGLRGEEILITARIVSTCNAYVAFVSPRAHRAGMSLTDALDVISKDSNKAFDGHVVTALRHYIENRPNKLDWLLQSKPADVSAIA